MDRLEDIEYQIFDLFVKTATRFVAEGRMDASAAHAEIMHVFTALDRGNPSQFMPYMNMRLREWQDTIP